MHISKEQLKDMFVNQQSSRLRFCKQIEIEQACGGLMIKYRLIFVSTYDNMMYSTTYIYGPGELEFKNNLEYLKCDRVDTIEFSDGSRISI
jgi:hypothetical protein